MRDINNPLRVAYAAALTQIPGMGVYYQNAPNNNSSLDNYIVFRSITSNDASAKNAARLNVSITIEIHTRQMLNNTGANADEIADQVYQLVYPDKRSNLVLSRGSILWTNVQDDRTIDYQQKAQFGYLNRFITFGHCIFVDLEGGDSGGGTVPVVQGQLFRLEYTGIGGEVGFTDELLVGRRVVAVFKDGVDFSPILTSGVPVAKQSLYQANIGGISTAIPLEPGEEMAVLWQLNNAFQTLDFTYTAVGGEAVASIPSLANVQIYAVLVDGVSASQILFTGTPINKQVLYTKSAGDFTFAGELEPNQEVKILYQL